MRQTPCRIGSFVTGTAPLVLLAASYWLAASTALAQGGDAPFVAPTRAAAPTCDEGRVAVELGYCCWPGQHATDDGRCMGPPTCPRGLTAAGAECVPLALHASAPTSQTTTDGSFAERPPMRNERDEGLIGGGVALILVGWLGAAITDTIGGNARSDVYVRATYVSAAALPRWPFGWLPLAHPFAALDANGGWGLAAGIVGGLGAAMELTGLIMAIVGTIGHAPTRPRRGSASTQLRLGAPGAQAGLTLEITL